MRKILQLIIIILGLTSCSNQEVDGIWMSYNNYIIDTDSAYYSGNEGIIIDFDKQTISYIQNDSIVPINIDFKKSKLFVKNDTTNVEFKVYEKDSIEIDFDINIMHVFRPLNLNHKLSINENQISSFLTKSDFFISNYFDKNNGKINIEFSDKPYFIDVMFKEQNKKNALINKSWEDEGYWYVKEIKQNFFLVFALDQTADQNIYQIISLDDSKMKLKQLQEAEFGNAKITELKTSL
ncbi:hypothetical protein [Psychroserpens sp.]|uniref:hypothetical protein n=1 Tax=Psychroserpens sp. TaxID=2020870 RepID=UPI002B26E04D|nr:hypothetical protein [Psychroserpens sp.]